MPKSLQVAALVARVLREPRVRGDEQRGDGAVIGRERLGPAAEEQKTDRHADGHVRAVGQPGGAAAAGRSLCRRSRRRALLPRVQAARVQAEAESA